MIDLNDIYIYYKAIIYIILLATNIYIYIYIYYRYTK